MNKLLTLLFAATLAFGGSHLHAGDDSEWIAPMIGVGVLGAITGAAIASASHKSDNVAVYHASPATTHVVMAEDIDDEDLDSEIEILEDYRDELDETIEELEDKLGE